MRVSIIFTGPTGTGKSTLRNIIRGLLKEKGYEVREDREHELDVRWDSKEEK